MAQDESVIQKAWASMMSASGRRAKFKDKLSDGTPMNRDKTAATLRTLVRAGLWNPHLDSQQAQDNWRSAIAQILHEKMALYNDPGREFVNDAIIGQCLAAGVDPNARDKERHFDTLWGQALRRNLVSAGAELLGTGQCDLELADGTGTPALYTAWCVDTEKGRKRGSIWFEMLMDEGAQINTLARLEKGANPKRAEELVPTNPLIEAASHGCEAGIAFFLSHGADPNAADPKGRRAIHHLARRNPVGGQDLVDFKQSQARSMDLLIQAGADLDACDHHGQTALVVAMRAGLSDNALLLLGKGARADIRVVSEDGFNGGYCLHAPAIASIPLEKLEPVLHEIETRARMENMNSNPAAPAPIDFYKPRDEGINGLGGFYRLDDQLNNALDALISARSGGMERADSAHSAFPRYSLSAMLGRGALFVSYDNEHMNAISRRAFSDGIRFFVHRDLIDELNVANLDASNKITDSLAREWMADALLLGACNVMGVDWIDGVPRLGFATRLSYPDSAPPVVPEHLSARNSITWIDPSLLRDIMINAYGASSSLLAVDESIGKTDVVSNQAMVKAACQDYSEASQMALLSFEGFANAQSGKLSSQTASASGFGEHLLEINNSISNLLISAQNCEHMFVGTSKDEIDNRAFFLSPQDHLTLFGKVKTWASTRDNAILTDISDVGHLGIRTSLMLSLKREAAIAGWDLTQEDLERITNTFSASPNISRKEIEILIDALSGYDEIRPAKPLDVQERACAAGIAGKSRLGLFGKDFDQALKLIAKPAHFHSQIMAASGGSLYPSHTAPNLLDQCREVASGRRPWVDDLVAYAPTEVMREALTKMDTHPALTQEHVVAACAHYNAIEHVNALVEFHAGKNDHTRPLDKFDPNPIIEALLSHVPARKEAQLHDLLVNLQDHGLDLGAFDAHAIQLPQDAHAKVAPDLATVLRAKASWEARSMDRRVSQSPSRPRSRL